jgi:hypothetical protein
MLFHELAGLGSEIGGQGDLFMELASINWLRSPSKKDFAEAVEYRYRKLTHILQSEASRSETERIVRNVFSEILVDQIRVKLEVGNFGKALEMLQELRRNEEIRKGFGETYSRNLTTGLLIVASAALKGSLGQAEKQITEITSLTNRADDEELPGFCELLLYLLPLLAQQKELELCVSVERQVTQRISTVRDSLVRQQLVILSLVQRLRAVLINPALSSFEDGYRQAESLVFTQRLSYESRRFFAGELVPLIWRHLEAESISQVQLLYRCLLALGRKSKQKPSRVEHSVNLALVAPNAFESFSGEFLLRFGDNCCGNQSIGALILFEADVFQPLSFSHQQIIVDELVEYVGALLTLYLGPPKNAKIPEPVYDGSVFLDKAVQTELLKYLKSMSSKAPSRPTFG